MLSVTYIKILLIFFHPKNVFLKSAGNCYYKLPIQQYKTFITKVF